MILKGSILFVFIINIAIAKDERSWYHPIKVADNTQAYISKSWNKMNYGVDSFFANEDFEDEVNRSYIRINSAIQKQEGADLKYQYDFKFKLDFPHTKRKLKIILEKDNEDENTEGLSSINSTNQNSAEDALTETSYNAALRRILTESKKWIIYADTGMRLKLPLDPFIKLRVRRSFTYNKFETKVIQKFYLYRQKGFGESTHLNFDYPFADIFHISFNNSFSWNDKTDNYSVLNSLTFFKKLSDKRAISYNISSYGDGKPKIIYKTYTTSINYRQLIHKTWLYTQISTGAIFSKSRDFKMKKFVTVVFEVLF